MLKIKDKELKCLDLWFECKEKTHFIYFEESGIRVNKHTGIIELGNFKYSPYYNAGKSKYNIPNILLEMCEMGIVEIGEQPNGEQSK